MAFVFLCSENSMDSLLRDGECLRVVAPARTNKKTQKDGTMEELTLMEAASKLNASVAWKIDRGHLWRRERRPGPPDSGGFPADVRQPVR
jgi:hypothetical protein